VSWSNGSAQVIRVRLSRLVSPTMSRWITTEVRSLQTSKFSTRVTAYSKTSPLSAEIWIPAPVDALDRRVALGRFNGDARRRNSYRLGLHECHRRDQTQPGRTTRRDLRQLGRHGRGPGKRSCSIRDNGVRRQGSETDRADPPTIADPRIIARLLYGVPRFPRTCPNLSPTPRTTSSHEPRCRFRAVPNHRARRRSRAVS